MDVNLCVTVVLVVCSSLPGSCAIEVMVRLIDGQSSSQGKVMVRDMHDQSSQWKPICAKSFGRNAADVVCRQLGYRYSLNEPNIYMSKIPDWINYNVHCHGNESNIGQCFQGTHSCFHGDDSYAAVCCSNSSEFGDWIDGMFVSHCADSWLGAQKRCEELGSSLTVLGDENAATLGTIKGHVWNGQFLTPWIWANDCVRFKRKVRTAFREVIIPHNSPGLCFQLCGHAPRTTFALSGAVCRCVVDDKSIESVEPRECRAICPGNVNQYCGDDKQQFWDLYRIGSQDNDFAVYSAFPNATRQCASLIRNSGGNYKLQSQQCTKRAGYVCSEFQKKSKRGYIALSSPSTLTTARHACRKADTWKLVGSDVMNATIYSSETDGLWVDIESSLVPIYNIEGLKVSHNIDPERCQSVTFANYSLSGPSSEIFECKKTRLLYTCSPTGLSAETTRMTRPSSQPDLTTIATTVVDGPDPSQQTLIRRDIEIWEISIAVLIALVLAILLVTVFVCWKKRKRRLRNAQDGGTINGAVLNEVSYYSALDPSSMSEGQYDLVREREEEEEPSDPAKEPLNVYEELPDNTIYQELQPENPSPNEEAAENIDVIKEDTDECVGVDNSLVVELRKQPNEIKTDDNEINAGTGDGAIKKKESVKLKASYATPMDTVREKPGVKRYDSNAVDPKYSFPYDSVERLNNELRVNGKIVEETKEEP